MARSIYSYDRRIAASKPRSRNPSFLSSGRDERAPGKWELPVTLDDDGPYIHEDDAAEVCREAVKDADPTFRPYGSPADPSVGYGGGLEEVTVDNVVIEFKLVWSKHGPKGTDEQLLGAFTDWIKSKPVISDTYEIHADEDSPRGFRGESHDFNWEVEHDSGLKVVLGVL